jgi:hypothetical protein
MWDDVRAPRFGVGVVESEVVVVTATGVVVVSGANDVVVVVVGADVEVVVVSGANVGLVVVSGANDVVVELGPPGVVVELGPPGVVVELGPPGVVVELGPPGVVVELGPPGVVVVVVVDVDVVVVVLVEPSKLTGGNVVSVTGPLFNCELSVSVSWLRMLLSASKLTPAGDAVDTSSPKELMLLLSIGNVVFSDPWSWKLSLSALTLKYTFTNRASNDRANTKTKNPIVDLRISIF